MPEMYNDSISEYYVRLNKCCFETLTVLPMILMKTFQSWDKVTMSLSYYGINHEIR